MKITKVTKNLANGQVATVFLTKDKHNQLSYIDVGLYIGSSIGEAKKWFNDDHNYRAVKSTGTCGLEGLLFCKNVIMQLKGHNVRITWEDNKRKIVYSRLTSLGFKLRHFTDEPDENFYFICKNEW